MIVTIFSVDELRITVQTVRTNLIRFDIEETVVNTASIVQVHACRSTRCRIAGDDAVDHRQFLATVVIRKHPATIGGRRVDASSVADDRGVANNHRILLIYELNADSAAPSIASGADYTVAANETRIDRNPSKRTIGANSAAADFVSSRCADGVVGNDAVINLTARALGESDAAAIFGVSG